MGIFFTSYDGKFEEGEKKEIWSSFNLIPFDARKQMYRENVLEVGEAFERKESLEGIGEQEK